MNVISFLISIHYYMILYHIILHIGCIYFHRCINFLSQLIENNICYYYIVSRNTYACLYYSVYMLYYSIRHIEQLKLRSIDIL